METKATTVPSSTLLDAAAQRGAVPSRRDILGLVGVGTAALAGCASRFDTDPTTDGDANGSEPGDGVSTGTGETGPRATECDASWPGDPTESFEARSGFGRPVAAADRLYVGSSDGLLALTPDLDIDWEQPTVDGGVAEVVDGLVLASAGDRVIAADAERGEVLWTFEPPGEHARVAWGPSIHDGTVYVGASQVPTPETDPDTEYGRLYGLDPATGAESFGLPLTGPERAVVQPSYLIADDAGVFLTLESGDVVGVDHGGDVRWRRTFEDGYYRPERTGDSVLVPRSRSVVALAADTGETRWESHAVEMQVTADGGVVYGAGGGGPDEDGTLAALDAATGRISWETPIAGCGRGPAVGAGTVAVPVGCRGGPGHVALHDADTGCRYGEYDQSADLTPLLRSAHGRLYASAGESRERLLAFDLP